MTGSFGLTLAFFAGIGGAFHCLGMCGPLATGIFIANHREVEMRPHLIYHGVRITVYTILGTTGALIGGVIVQTGSMGKVQGLLFMLAGAGVSMFGINMLFRLFSGQKAPLPWRPLRVDFHEHLRVRRHIPLIGGILNGMVPCSLVFSVALKAAATADPMDAALIMFAFGLGTLPAMALATAAGTFTGSLRQKTTKVLSGVLVILFGLWTLYEGVVFYDIMRGLAD